MPRGAASTALRSRCGVRSSASERRQVRERRVEEVARRRRDERQRVAPREFGVAGGRLARRDVVGQRIVSLRGQRRAREFALARRRREVALRERRVGDGHVEALPAVAQQRVEIEVARGGVVALPRRARHRLVGVAEAGLGEAHARGEPAEHLGVGQRFAERRDRRIVRERVQVPVRRVHVELLELRGRRQQDVREVGGVGLEDLVHDAEEVLAREARAHAARLGRDGDRVRVVDVDRADRRVGAVEQRVADRAHVDRARPAADQVGPLERVMVDRVRARRREQGAAGGIAPRTDQRGQARDRAHGVAAAGDALHAVVERGSRRASSCRTRARAPRLPRR